MTATRLAKTQVDKKRPVILAFFSCIIVAIFISSCSKSPKQSGNLLTISGETMGTSYSIKVIPVNADHADSTSLEAALAQEIEKTLLEYNQIMSTYLPDSELSRLNRAPENEWLKVSEALFSVLNISQQVSQQSQGAFDITVMPLVNLWGFGPQKRDSPPTEEEINSTLESVGFQFIELEEGRVKKSRPLTLDLSAVAKGYASDVIAEQLEAREIVNYMVEIGGEIKMRGVNAQGKPWLIGIEKPALGREGAMQGISEQTIAKQLDSSGIAVATSGDYRNYYEREGKRISHTIIPQTGYPIEHGLASVTVVHEKCGYADAFATALNVLGPIEGYNMAVEAGLAAFFIVRDKDSFRIQYTDEFKKYMVTL